MGVELHQWQVDKLELNVLDFAGQDLYQATHQLFLSPRTVQMIVWDASKEQVARQIEPWLVSLQAHVPGSSILLVATHTDKVPADTLQDRVNEAEACAAELLRNQKALIEARVVDLRQQLQQPSARGGGRDDNQPTQEQLEQELHRLLHSGSGQEGVRVLSLLQGGKSLSVDSLGGHGVASVREAIVAAAHALPQVGIDLPTTYAAVRERVMELRKDPKLTERVLTMAEYAAAMGHLEDLEEATRFWAVLGDVYLKDQLVVLDPSFIVRAVTELVRHGTFRPPFPFPPRFHFPPPLFFHASPHPCALFHSHFRQTAKTRPTPP